MEDLLMWDMREYRPRSLSWKPFRNVQDPVLLSLTTRSSSTGRTNCILLNVQRINSDT